MRSFSKYKETVFTQEPTSTPPPYTQEDDVARMAKQIVQAYDGKPSGEMLRSILAQAEASKRAGTLSNQEIDAFYEQFAPMLDARQQKMLQSVVEKLKRI